MTAAPGKKSAKPDGRLILGAVTLFSSAALSFSIQPMMGKMLLPYVGGAPSGWLVTLAFFQIALLAGYALAYALSRQTHIIQFSATLALLTASLGFLPPHIAKGTIVPGNGAEALSVLIALCATLGLPFIALACLSPALQRLFKESASRNANNPYLLFAASNLGSFAGLLSYPLWFERHMGLAQQSGLWQTGYALTLALASLCLVIALRDQRNKHEVPTEACISKPVVTWKQRAEWIFLAFLPSSLMMGVTEQISQEAFFPPYFRILPLAIYLLTLVSAFARQRDGLLTKFLRILQPVTVVLVMTNAIAAPYDTGLTPTAPLFGLIAFWPTAVLCHNKLAKRRPDSAQLSEYYLYLAAGGALGGILNVFLAPLLFPVPVEFTLVLLIASWSLFPASTTANKPFWRNKLLWISSIAAVAATLFPLWKNMLNENAHAEFALIAILIALLLTIRQPRGLVVTSALCVALAFVFPEQPRPRAIERNFFEILRVKDQTGEDGSVFRALYGGTTPQSIIKIAPKFSLAPVAAYNESSILGNLAQLPNIKNIGLAGFGAGAFLCAFPKNKEFTAIDINPATFNLSAKWFGVMDRCAYPKIIIGDARLALQNDPDKKYDLLILDVFYGTALPMHMLTREAFKIYFDRLSPSGVIAFHVFSPHYDLSQSLGDMAAIFNAKALSRLPALDQPEKLWKESLWLPTPWIAMTRDENMAARLRKMEWKDIPALGFEPMTDDFNDSISLMKDASHAQTR